MSSPIRRPQASKQHGQTLAEFAISLPLVLLLLFGILEFGRMFQSWVTLQNAARSAVRYAVTGQYNTTKYDLDYLVPCYRTNQVMDPVTYDSYRMVNGAVKKIGVNGWKPHDAFNQPPAVTFEMINIDNPILLKDEKNNGYARRVDQAYKKDNGTLIIERWDTLTQAAIDDIKAKTIDKVTELRVVALNPDESLYATWYGRDGVEDCEPNDDTLQYRKDLVRLASIYDEARRGATGLALDASITGDGTLNTFQNFLYSFWSNPSQFQGRDAWFNVTICSARSRMYSTDNTFIKNNPDDSKSTVPANFDTLSETDQAPIVNEATFRYHTFRGPGEAPNGNPGEAYVGGACILKEYPRPSNGTMVKNYDVPWADAGSAGERITIIITYNHPLITPLGLARYVRMQASRSAVNEAFKIVNAERATGGGGSGNGDIFLTNTPIPPDTPVGPTATDTATATLENTPQNTATFTKTPFDCSKLFAEDVEFKGQNTIYVKLRNDNIEDTIYLYSKISWPATRITAAAASPDAYAAFVSIENQVNWAGYQDKANISPLLTNSPTYGDSFMVDEPSNSSDVYSPGVYINVPAKGTSRWQLTFVGLTKPIYELMLPYELNGTRIYLQNPDDPKGPGCAIALTGPEMVAPTATPVGYISPTPTTPNCANVKYDVSFVEFMINGDVHLRIRSTSSGIGYFRGFSINWQPAKDIIGTSLKFLKLTVNGRNADDVATSSNPNGAGTIIWQSAAGGTTTIPTVINAGNAEWMQDYAFSTGTTDVYLDFTGIGALTLAERGVPASAFNGSQFRISCNRNGTGGNGNGTDPEGDISLATSVPPPPAGTPTKTLTPGPTYTPTKTYTPGPTSTNTLVPPPTVKPADTVTPKPTNTFTPVPTSTPDIKECSDRC